MPTHVFPLTAPLHDLAAWTECFRDADIPVIAATAEALEALRENEDDVDANLLGEMIASDPLMTLKVLAYAACHRTRRLVTDTETVTASLVMMGISPFFRDFGAQPTIEETLRDSPEALEGLQQVLRRAHRAANFALGFAVRRMDPDAAVIHQAGLLHDFAEMLLWCHAPALALKIRDQQRNDASLRSRAAQSKVLNIELHDLQHALMQTWRLPRLLLDITDDRHAEHPTARSVVLAIRLARHTAQGWDNAAVPDDVRDIAQLLNLSESAALQVLNELDT